MTTPDRIYIEVLNGITTPRWAPNREDKTDVEYIRADIHEAEIDALKAENAQLLYAMSAIRQYGRDSLSGPARAPVDLVLWYRDGIREMTKRARDAMKLMEAK